MSNALVLLSILVASAPLDEWKTNTVAEGVSVQAPGFLRLTDVEAPKGSKLWRLVNGGCSYVVGIAPLPSTLKTRARAKRILTGIEQGIVGDDLRGKVEFEKAIELKGYFGYEVRLRKPTGLRCQFRVYFSKTYVYQAFAMWSAESGEPKNLRRYLDSFRVPSAR